MEFYNDLSRKRASPQQRDFHNENLMKADLRIKHAIQKIQKVNSGNNAYHTQLEEHLPLKTIVVEDNPMYFCVNVKDKMLPCILSFKNQSAGNLTAFASTKFP